MSFLFRSKQSLSMAPSLCFSSAWKTWLARLNNSRYKEENLRLTCSKPLLSFRRKEASLLRYWLCFLVPFFVSVKKLEATCKSIAKLKTFGACICCNEQETEKRFLNTLITFFTYNKIRKIRLPFDYLMNSLFASVTDGINSWSVRSSPD